MRNELAAVLIAKCVCELRSCVTSRRPHAVASSPDPMVVIGLTLHRGHVLQLSPEGQRHRQQKITRKSFCPQLRFIVFSPLSLSLCVCKYVNISWDGSFLRCCYIVVAAASSWKWSNRNTDMSDYDSHTHAHYGGHTENEELFFSFSFFLQHI